VVALLRVGMAELKTSANGDVLQALGLGSCIGLAMYDRRNHVGGMVHVMLPDSTMSTKELVSPGKFADTGVEQLLKEVLSAGASRVNLTVKMAGGAEMFAFGGSDSPRLSIGKRNAEAVNEQLSKLGLHACARDIGANYGRTFEVDLQSLSCTIRVVGRPPYEI
jgi:chemotaxis protein CheD